MAVALISNVDAAPGANGGATGAIDTTGATLLVVIVSDFTGVSAAAPTDSKSNSWTGLTAKTQGNVRTAIFYSVPTSVGSGHTFTYASIGGFPAIAVLAFSGSKSSSPFDVENGAVSAAATSRTTGSILPTEDSEVLVAGLGLAAVTGSPSIDGGFTKADEEIFGAGNNFGLASAYLIQTTAGAANPAWSWSTAVDDAAVIASFKVAAVATGGYPGSAVEGRAFQHPPYCDRSY